MNHSTFMTASFRFKTFVPAFLLFVGITATSRAQTSASKPSDIGRPTVSIGHSQRIAEAHLSPDGKKLFTMDNSNLRVWDVESGKELKLLKSYDGGNNPWEATWQPVFSESKKWMLIPRRGRVAVFNYETLEEFSGWNGWSPRAAVWDDKRGIGYFVDVKERDGLYRIGELTLAGDKWEQQIKTTVQVVTESKRDPHCRRLILLEGNRLLVDTTGGYFVIDLKTWNATRFDREPDRSKSTPEMPWALFTNAPTDKEYFAGPEGTILTLPTELQSEKKLVTIEVLSSQNLAVLRSGQLKAEYAYLDISRSFDPKSRTLWVRGFRHLHPVNFDTLATGESISLEETLKADAESKTWVPYTKSAARLPEDNQWLITTERITRRFDAASQKSGASFGDRVAVINRLITGPKGLEFLVTNGITKAKRVRILPRGFEITTVPGPISSFAYDPSGELIARGNSGGGEADITEATDWTKVDYRIPAKPAENAQASNLKFAEDGSILLIHGSVGVAAVSLNDGKLLLNEKLSNTWIHDDPDLITISPDNRWVVAYDGKHKAVGFDLTRPAGQRRMWEQDLKSYATLFHFISPSVFLCSRDGHLEYRNAETGAVLVSHDLERTAGIGRSSALSRDKKFAAICSSEVKIYDTETGKLLWEHDLATNVTHVAFFPDPRFLVTVQADNLIRLWDLTEKRELCTLALFEDNNEWVVSTGDLRFDASEKAIGKMYVVKGTDIIPLESLFNQLYTPKLLSSLLTGVKLEDPKIDVQKIRVPPTVKLEFADATRNLVVEDDVGDSTNHDLRRLRATADSRESQLGEIRFYQNGKLLQTISATGRRATQDLQAKLVPGENVFRAIAFSADRAESTPAEVTVTYRPKTSAPIAGTTAQQPAGLQLHLLVVGVNTYKNPKYNLNYAVADATAVKDRIEAQTKSIFTAVNVSFILNERAQKDAITEAFKTISTKAGPRDVFVFYYAGHGVMTADATPEFFLVPHDVTQLYGADDALRQKGLSSAELMELSRLMPAQKQLFILDACQSAGALKTVAMRGAAEEKAIAQLARSTGTHWLTASGSEQFATEFAQLGHGAFTYALIEGLAGKADTGDGRVTVNELKAFLESEVPEITQKHKGTPQYPSSYGFGQDFPVVVITK
jgi:WD40 repeat protein